MIPPMISDLRHSAKLAMPVLLELHIFIYHFQSKAGLRHELGPMGSFLLL